METEQLGLCETLVLLRLLETLVASGVKIVQEEARFKFRALDFQYSDIDSEAFSKMRLNMLGKKRYAALSQEPVIESIPKRLGSL